MSMKSEDSFQATRTRSAGHQTLKSSALCPTGSKLTCRYMVLNNMMVHYRKLDRAKSCIDTSDPKAWIKRNKFPTKAGTLHKSAMSTARQDTYTEADYYDDDFEPSGTTGRYRPMAATDRDRRADNDKASVKLREELDHYLKTGVDMPKYDDHDLIARHSDFFTSDVKPFTPRKLQNNRHESRLSTMPCYCPPRRARSKSRSAAAEPETRSTVSVQTGNGNGASRPGTGAALSDTLADDMMRSMDGRFVKQMPSDVPPLNISLDADNIRWLREHHSAKSAKRDGVSAAQTVGNQTRLTGSVPKDEKMNDVSKTTKQRLEDEDRNKYQDFMAEVLRDILERGIYTNCGLRKVFDSHVDKRNDLKPGKMREILTELEQKLGLPPDRVTSSAHTNDYGYVSTLRPSNADVGKDHTDRDREPARSRQSPKHVTQPSDRSPVRSGVGRPPLPRPGRRDSSGSGSLALEDFVGGSPPTPRRHQPVRQENPDVLTIDNGKDYHGTSRSSADIDEREDDGSNSGFDEIDYGRRNTRQQTTMKTMNFGSSQLGLRQSSMSGDQTDDSAVAEVEDKSGRRTKRRRYLHDNQRTPPSVSIKNDKSGRRTSPRQQQRSTDENLDLGNDVAELSASSATGSAVSVRAIDRRRQRHADATTRSDAVAASKPTLAVAKEDVLVTSKQLVDVGANDDDDDVDYNRAAAAAGMASHLTTLQPNDDEQSDGVGAEDADEYETNDELLDTLTIYQNKLEKTNYVDERGSDSDNGGVDTPTASSRSPPVPTPRARRNKDKAEADVDLDDDGRRSAADENYSSVEVSDLDENELNKMR